MIAKITSYKLYFKLIFFSLIFFFGINTPLPAVVLTEEDIKSENIEKKNMKKKIKIKIKKHI